ncbi:MAG: hypothetical protein PHH73_02025 [Candidatus Rickettsiella isopodorum]|nr:hypothetical protein [Candidatus Rickettsiella isopodorum]
MKEINADTFNAGIAKAINDMKYFGITDVFDAMVTKAIIIDIKKVKNETDLICVIGDIRTFIDNNANTEECKNLLESIISNLNNFLIKDTVN